VSEAVSGPAEMVCLPLLEFTVTSGILSQKNWVQSNIAAPSAARPPTSVYLVFFPHRCRTDAL
jgi:hypothetical protein